MNIPERMQALFTVTERGNGNRVIAYLNAHSIRFHMHLPGEGTAPTEMQELLGIGSTSKDVTLSFGSEPAMKRLQQELDGRLSSIAHARGILVFLPFNAISNLFSTLLIRQAGQGAEKGNDTMEEASSSKQTHSLICVAVNRGFAEAVADAARKAGATGGTVIRARLTGTEDVAKFFGSVLGEEREIVTILAANSARDAIMDEVNAACGLHSKAQGLLFALPVDRAYKM